MLGCWQVLCRRAAALMLLSLEMDAASLNAPGAACKNTGALVSAASEVHKACAARCSTRARAHRARMLSTAVAQSSSGAVAVVFEVRSWGERLEIKHLCEMQYAIHILKIFSSQQLPTTAAQITHHFFWPTNSQNSESIRQHSHSHSLILAGTID